MFIKKIQIKNFRQLKDIEIELQENTSILAGPNNSGKTSVILLLKRIFTEKSFIFAKEDFNVYDKVIWGEKIYQIIKEKTINTENVLKAVIENIFPIESQEENKGLKIPELIVNMQVDYCDNDDISNFAEYIMDLEEEKNSIYFQYKVVLKNDLFQKNIKSNIEKIINRLENNEKDEKKESIVEIILDAYCKSLTNKCFFTDEKNLITSEIKDINTFKNLFNFKYIEASRPVDDAFEKDKKSLSNILIASTSKSDDWNNEINEISDKILQTLGESKIKDKIEEISATALNETIRSISQTNGNNTGELILGWDVLESDIEQLIRSTTNAKYFIKDSQLGKYLLNETSQGLGYSNLIYIHTQIEDYIKTKDRLKVNFLVIEEPESHMHPQMQYVFSNKLLEQYDKENLQGLLTTHSSEIIRGASIEKLRVIRQETLFNSKIYNLSSFINKLDENYPSDSNTKSLVENHKDFYQLIGISEIIFADCAILFEGDTERLYLKNVLMLDKYKELQKKYIAYIQVGNAYAYAFKDILKFLKIKSLIITDIDYDKNVESKEVLEAATISNSTIKKFYNSDFHNSNDVQVKNLYNWIEDKKHIVEETEKEKLNYDTEKEDLIYLAFQTEKDNYTRTLEAAMLAKKFNITGFDLITRNEWISKKKESKLNFSIPNNKKNDEGEEEINSEFTLIDILNSTKNGKSNFMYSVILNNYTEEMLPNYIEEGLTWLMK